MWGIWGVESSSRHECDMSRMLRNNELLVAHALARDLLERLGALSRTQDM